MNNKDLIIKDKLKKDKQISDKAEKIFNNFKEEFKLENNEGRKVIKISFSKFLAIAATFVIVLFLGVGLYTNKLWKNDSTNGMQGIQAEQKDEPKVPEIILDKEWGKDNIKLKYPSDWKLTENEIYAEPTVLESPENSNGEKAKLYITINENTGNRTAKEIIETSTESDNSKTIDEGEKNIAGVKAYYKTQSMANNVKSTTVILIKGIFMYEFRFTGIEEEYTSYYPVFEKILETVEINELTYIGEKELNESNDEEDLIESNDENIELTNYINSEIGVQFYYPGEWTQKDNNHGSGAVGVWLNKDSNEKHIENVYLWVEDRSSEENYLSPEESVKRYESSTGNDEKGKININGNEGYYINKSGYRTENNTKYENKEKIIYVKANNRMYRIAYSGDKKLYDKYYDAFSEILKTIKFRNPVY